jgi:secreted trypsin-like serine protease
VKSPNNSHSTTKHCLNFFPYQLTFPNFFVAARCFYHEQTGEKKKPDDVVAWVGVYDLSRTTEGRIATHQVSELLIHEDWSFRSESLDADIALAVLESEVDLSSPFICLPPKSHREVIATGTVVRWSGRESTEANQTVYGLTPSELRLSAIPRAQCLSAESKQENFSSPRTFCGRYANQTACEGNHGSGFYVYDNLKKIFTLVGISSNPQTSSDACTSGNHSIFTDVTKFVDWIHRKVKETKTIKWKEVDFECEESDEYATR